MKRWVVKTTRWLLPATVVALGAGPAVAAPAPAPPTIAGPPSGAVLRISPTFVVKGGPGSLITWSVTPRGAQSLRGRGPSPLTVGPLPLRDGPYRLTAVQSIGLLTSAAAISDFTLDTVPPVPFGLTAPGDGMTTSLGRPQISWTGSADGGSGLAAYRLLVDGKVASPLLATTITSAPPTNELAAGPHAVSVQAIDRAGNARAAPARTITIDTAAPAAPTVIGAPDGPTSSRTPVFSWQPTEPGGSFAWEVVDRDGRVTASGTTGASSVAAALPATAPSGLYSFSVRQLDAAGNAGATSAPRIFSLDVTPPQLLLAGLTPVPDAVGTGRRAPLLVSFAEPVAPLTRHSLSLVCRSGACAGAPAPVHVWASPDGTRASIEPRFRLRPHTRYEVVSAGVADEAGNGLVAPTSGFRWRFRTGEDGRRPQPVQGVVLTREGSKAELRWSPLRDAGVAQVRVLRREGAPPRGAFDPAAVAFSLGPGARRYTDRSASPTGRYAYGVYAVDRAGNPSAVAMARAPRAPGVVVAPHVLNGALLNPAPAATVGDSRPLLRWSPPPSQAAPLYNIALFGLRSRRPLISVFQSGTSYRVPANVLDKGRRYIWRVWPYRNRRPLQHPLGVSYFSTPPA